MTSQDDRIVCYWYLIEFDEADQDAAKYPEYICEPELFQRHSWIRSLVEGAPEGDNFRIEVISGLSKLTIGRSANQEPVPDEWIHRLMEKAATEVVKEYTITVEVREDDTIVIHGLPESTVKVMIMRSAFSQKEKMDDALRVFVFSREIRGWLLDHDPKALAQAMDSLNLTDEELGGLDLENMIKVPSSTRRLWDLDIDPRANVIQVYMRADDGEGEYQDLIQEFDLENPDPETWTTCEDLGIEHHPMAAEEAVAKLATLDDAAEELGIKHHALTAEDTIAEPPEVKFRD